VKIAIEDLGSGRKKASIEAGWTEVEPDYEDLLSEYGKLPVPGFRPGKAPRSMVEKHFLDPLLDDTAARCVRRISRAALKSKGITTTGPVSITEISIVREKQVSFVAEFIELPVFDLPDYSSIPLKAGSDGEMRDSISLFLLENTDLDVPDGMVKQELSFDDLEDADPGDDDWSGALSRVKLLLILGAVARRNGIEIDDRDVEERIAHIARANEADPAALKKQMMQTGGLSRIADFLVAERTLDYLIEKCRH
jgi:FKBP-type peptidyl-prolyl cis-trans isomerase (trigger factor)